MADRSEAAKSPGPCKGPKALRGHSDSLYLCFRHKEGSRPDDKARGIDARMGRAGSTSLGMWVLDPGKLFVGFPESHTAVSFHMGSR